MKYKAFVAQFCQLVMPFKIGFRNLGQITYFFGVTCIHNQLVTFSESTGLIIGVVKIKYGLGLFSWFYSIWETEVERSIQSSRRFCINKYKPNF